MHIIWQRVSISKHEVVCKTWHFCSRLRLDHQWSLMLLPQLAIQWYYWCVQAATSVCQHYLFLDLLNLVFSFQTLRQVSYILYSMVIFGCCMFTICWQYYSSLTIYFWFPGNVSAPASCVANILALQFNIKKCHCIVIGKMHNIDKTPVILCGSIVIWCNSIKYLGIYLLASKVLKFDVIACRRSFYRLLVTLFLCVVLV